MRRRNPYLEKEWQDKIECWVTSGKSVKGWCRENNINKSKFYYWRRKLTEIQSSPLQKNETKIPFIEVLPDKPHSRSGIEISVKHAAIHLSKDFDEVSLLRCLKVLEQI